MATEIKVPSLGESITEATVAKWLKRPGEAVAADEPIAELETDKVTLEVPAPASGTLAEILETVRGFYVTNDRYQSYVGVRGFGRLGDWNSRILLLVDGHRINDNVLGQAFIGLEFPVDIDLIQRIEIIRGPSSSLYGAEAFFGVINVITRKENQPSLAVPKIPRTQSVKMAPDSASNSRTASIPTAAQQSD